MQPSSHTTSVSAAAWLTVAQVNMLTQGVGLPTRHVVLVQIENGVEGTP
jgi:hypothetical protein